MELRAITQRRPPEPVTPADPGTYTRTISVRVPVLLYETVSSFLAAAHTTGDYTYPSVAAFVRAALAAYAAGLRLTEQALDGLKRETSLRLDDALWHTYKGLPSQKRTEVLERIVRTFMRQQ